MQKQMLILNVYLNLPIFPNISLYYLTVVAEKASSVTKIMLKNVMISGQVTHNTLYRESK